MAEQDVLSSPSPPEPRRHPLPGLKRLSDRTPLRTKLITAVLVLVIMALAAISTASVYMLRSYVTTQHDSDLKSGMVTATATNHPLARGVGLGTAGPTQSNIVEGVQEPGQQLTWGTYTNLPGLGTPDPLPQLPTNGLWPGSKPGDAMLVSLPAQSGTHTWRVLAQTVGVQTEPNGANIPAVLVVAEDIGDIDALTMRLILFDLVVGGAIVIGLAAVAIGVVRANLRPLDDIELTAGQIAKGHLDHRVPEGDPRTEVGSLSRSLNAMLSQIERAFNAQHESEQAAHHSEERMRRFIADASHELRTPLTTIRGFAAHYRQRGGASGSTDNLSPDDLDHLMARVESEATRMGLLVEDLLTLARLDQQRPLAKAPVDLLTLAADAVQDARIVSPGRPIDLTVAPGTAFLVDGDEPRLRQVLGNLVNNAITHTPAGTPVRVTIGRGTIDAGQAGQDAGPSGQDGGPAVVLDVSDEGPGMTTDQAQRVFERFYRADAARNRSSGGTGLGLAIVAGLVAAHGGTVSLRTAPGQGADFQVKLPLSPDALADDEADTDDETDDESPV